VSESPAAPAVCELGRSPNQQATPNMNRVILLLLIYTSLSQLCARAQSVIEGAYVLAIAKADVAAKDASSADISLSFGTLSKTSEKSYKVSFDRSENNVSVLNIVIHQPDTLAQVVLMEGEEIRAVGCAGQQGEGKIPFQNTWAGTISYLAQDGQPIAKYHIKLSPLASPRP
jgi:hypothetical protein